MASKKKGPPNLVKRTAEKLKKKGYDKEAAFAIATSTHQKSGSVAKNSQKLTKLGEARQKMTPKQRQDARKKGSVRQTTKRKKK